MNYVTLIGFCAAILTTVAFIPQAIRVYKLKETRDLSLSTFLMFTFGVFCWLMYGLLQKDLPVTIANAVTLMLAVVILGYKLKYG